MRALSGHLAEYDVRLRSVAPHVANALADGLQREAVVGRLDAAAVPPHPDLVDWFGWHDGYKDANYQLPIFGGYWMRSLEFALDRTERLRLPRGSLARAHLTPLASPSALRISDEAGGRALWFETTGEEETGPGLYVLPYRGEATVRVGDGLASLVEAWLELLDLGLTWNGSSWTIAPGASVPSDVLLQAGYPLWDV